MSALALEMKDVSKSFDTVQAVRDLSFSINEGEIFCLLGPNGAGKSTLVRMIVDIIRPDSGSISLPGGRLGYLPEDRGLYREAPVLRTIEFFGVLHGMTRSDARREALAWLERLELHDRRNDKLESLSKGNQQKVQFITAVLHRPDLAILDEPFSGLDPVNQNAFLEMIRELRDAGMTILLSAHQMDLVEKIGDRMLLVNKGLEVLSGTLEEIQGRYGNRNRITFFLASGSNADGLAGHPDVERVEPDDGSVSVRLRTGADLSGFLTFAGSQLSISGIHSDRVSLHEIFVEAVGRKEAS